MPLIDNVVRLRHQRSISQQRNALIVVADISKLESIVVLSTTKSAAGYVSYIVSNC
jgi:hypothetical protein